MKNFADEYRRCLDELDVSGVRKLWVHTNPNHPQPKTDQEALIMLHHARTQTRSVAFKKRAYSHRWLVDNGFPSGMPDELKPRAERIYPKVVTSVGIACVTSNALLKPILGQVRTAMENAVQEAYADNNTEPGFLKARMKEARELTLAKLL